MNQNQISDENLRIWNEQQEQMKTEATKRLDSLLKQKSLQRPHGSQPDERTWIDEAVERGAKAIDHFEKSVEIANKFRVLAQEGRLHNPACG